MTAELRTTTPAGDLAVAGLEFLDGERWALARVGIGRPFTVRLLLVNRGATPVRLWQPGTAEGDACPAVLLTSEAGHETVLRPPPVIRAAATRHFVSVEPGRLMKIDLELLRLGAAESPKPGAYRLCASYENVIPRSMGVDGVWTGRLLSESRSITITLP